MKDTLRFLSTVLVLVIMTGCGLSSCDKKPSTPDWEWDDTTTTNPNANKPRYLWVDAAANFPDFANSVENIRRDLTIAKNTGFTDIIVDVRPTTGDVLFTTDVVDQVAYLGAWVNGTYTRIDRTATFDYLRAFIDEGHKLGLKIHAGFNTMVGGNTSPLGSQGVVFRDNVKKLWATDLNRTGGIVNIMNTSNNAKFFNPVRPEVQNYLLSILEDLAAYQDLDGIVLDRCRFDGYDSDFSSYTKTKFEEYIGSAVTNFPASVIPPGTEVGKISTPYPTYYKQWLEFRVKTIHDFIVKAKSKVKSVNPDIKFAVYVGGWYSTYYDVGVNWASPKYNTSGAYGWATSNYKDYGYADHLDFLLIGAYAAANRVYGSSEWTMQGFCTKAKAVTMGDVPISGGPDGNSFYPSAVPAGTDVALAISNSVDACINAGDGYFFFDMIHLKQNNQWQFVKNGIDAAIAKK